MDVLVEIGLDEMLGWNDDVHEFQTVIQLQIEVCWVGSIRLFVFHGDCATH